MSLKRKCDQCGRLATHHSVEIIKGQKIEKHLCDQHAAEAGLEIKAAHTPINELLSNFVKIHGTAQGREEARCPHCGLTFSDFRKQSLLGCPNCYQAFEGVLKPLIERAHEGRPYHVGKIPKRAGAGQERQLQLLVMRKRLTEAVESEDYELAARLRDDIQRYEEQPQ